MDHTEKNIIDTKPPFIRSCWLPAVPRTRLSRGRLLYLFQLTVPTVGRFRATGDAFLTTDRVVFCASKPHGSQNGECEVVEAFMKLCLHRIVVVRSMVFLAAAPGLDYRVCISKH